ncbi:MAG: hypothetical protein VB087_01320 [Candidatus Limiplasma sp.]|nr:hypothetical protein [Candidatus Limiplasma sp.]
MNPILAFTIIMLIWTISDFVSKKTKSLLSSLLVASVIFLIGFKTNLFPEDLLTASSLLTLGSTIVGFVIVHIGTMISFREMKAQWRTFVIGFMSVIGIAVALFTFGFVFDGQAYVIGAFAAVSGGTISILMVQEAAVAAGLMGVAVLPVLIAAFQGMIGFPITSVLLRKEALRVRESHRAGALPPEQRADVAAAGAGKLPKMFQTTAGTLFAVGAVVLLASFISGLTGGVINTFIIALALGVLLRSTGVFKPGVLGGIDAFGLMMLAIMIIVFGPLATLSVSDLWALIVPLLLSFVIGLAGSAVFAVATGKLLGYSLSMSIAIGLTALYGFPGTMVLSQEAAKSAGESEAEVKIIEAQILPKMIVAGFSTVTITSVLMTSLLVGLIR